MSKNPVKNLSMDEFVELREWLTLTENNRGNAITQFNVACLLQDYEEARKRVSNGEETEPVAKLYFWMKWAQKHSISDGEIFNSIAHDMNGREDEKMCPRTSDYARETLTED
jgi:hypothetical protein